MSIGIQIHRRFHNQGKDLGSKLIEDEAGLTTTEVSSFEEDKLKVSKKKKIKKYNKTNIKKLVDW